MVDVDADFGIADFISNNRGIISIMHADIAGVPVTEIISFDGDVVAAFIGLIVKTRANSRIITALDHEIANGDIAAASELKSVTFIGMLSGSIGDDGSFATGAIDALERQGVSGIVQVKICQHDLTVIGAGVHIKDGGSTDANTVHKFRDGYQIGEVIGATANMVTAAWYFAYE